MKAVLWVFLVLAGVRPVWAGGADRVVIVSWDGAADWVVDRLLDQGHLPNVAWLAQTGVRAERCLAAFPSKTACGHAALWTGAWGDVNGVTGNAVPVLPRGEHTLLEQRSGFLSSALLAEPLFVTAAKAGKKVVVLSATQSFPPDPWVKMLEKANVPPSQFMTFDGFESRIENDKVWDGSKLEPVTDETAVAPHRGNARRFLFTVGESRFEALVYDDPQDLVVGMDTVLVRQQQPSSLVDDSRSVAAVTLKPHEAADHVQHFSPRFRVTKGDLFGYVYFRLFALAPDGHMVLYQRAVNGIRGTAPKEEIERYLDAYGGHHGAPFNAYEAGGLGKTLWQNGDGTAERRLLECVQLDCAFLTRGTRHALERFRPDLLFHYTPMSDSAGHTWMGVLDPESPRHDPVVAAKLWPYYAQVFALQDAWLGSILDHAGKDAAVCLVSDHGMAGVAKTFFPNAVLAKAGLLARTPDNKIDLARTQVCAPPWGDFFVSVNGTDWKAGIVPPGERAAVLRRATDALLNARDPETGRPIVTRVFNPEEVVGIGIGGLAGGDLYLDLAPGYVPTSRIRADAAIVEPIASPIGGGVHGFFPSRATMQAICFLGGAGVARGRVVSGMRQIDVAPTLARLLGIPAPAHAQGHVLGEVFAL